MSPDPRPAPPGVRFRPDRMAVFPVLVLLVCSLPVALTGPLGALVLLLPLACFLWVVRARVVVAPDGLEVSNGLGVRRVPWDRVEGYDVPRRGPVLLLTRGRRVPLTAVPRRQVRDLVQASNDVGSPGGPSRGPSRGAAGGTP